MKIGYARVSTETQNLDLQKDALIKYGCDKIYTDESTGSSFNRAGLNQALDVLREGDVFVVWKLDRLGRSTMYIIKTVQDLIEKGIQFVSLQESIDTTTPMGKMFFHIIAALAECERDIIRERTNAGLSAARARGRFGGRPNALSKEQIAHLRKVYKDKSMSISEIRNLFPNPKTGKPISKTTLYSYIKEWK